MLIEFTTPLVIASASARTITGRIVTFGEVGSTSVGPTRFERGSIAWQALPVLNLEHNKAQPIGRAVQMSETPEGIDAVFRIAATNAGNDALVEAADGLRSGFSVGVEVAEHTYDGPVMVVTASQLNHVAHVVAPAIRSAVVTGVAASETEPEPDPDDAPATPDEPSEEEETTVDTTTVETPPVVDATAAPLAVPSPARVQDGFPYGPQASHLSFFRDMLNQRHSVEASERVHKARTMMVDAAVTSVIPPGYRPDLYVEQIKQLTPVTSLCSQYPITDATAFTVPTFVSSSGLVGDAASGTNPASGTVSTSAVTVTPKAVSGIAEYPRDVIEATNPGLDGIIMSALIEDYSQDLETFVCATLVAGATAGVAGATTKYTKTIMDNLATYPVSRFLPVERIAAGPTAWKQLVGEVDTTGRYLNPYLGPVNASGQIAAAAATVTVAGVPVTLGWALAVQQLLFWRSNDVAVFTSGPREFREEGGTLAPGLIRFALWGYTGAAVLRAIGILKATQTP